MFNLILKLAVFGVIAYTIFWGTSSFIETYNNYHMAGEERIEEAARLLENN